MSINSTLDFIKEILSTPTLLFAAFQSRREELLPADDDALEELRRAVEDRFGE